MGKKKKKALKENFWPASVFVLGAAAGPRSQIRQNVDCSCAANDLPPEFLKVAGFSPSILVLVVPAMWQLWVLPMHLSCAVCSWCCRVSKGRKAG